MFVYQTVGQAIGVVFSLAAIILIDIIGRRPMMMFGALMLVTCNVIIGSIGPKTPNITSAEEGVVVASIMLLLSGTKISFQMGACECVASQWWWWGEWRAVMVTVAMRETLLGGCGLARARIAGRAAHGASDMV